MSHKDLSWLSEFQELATASPYRTVESYEKEGWMTMDTVRDHANKDGKTIGDKKIRSTVAELIKQGKWEALSVPCATDQGHVAGRRFYRPKKR